MIVTCESCKSRYKLDDAKITGKGAKITCPKCRNVFVVYARPDAGSADEPTPPPAERGSAAWEPRKNGGLAEAVKAADRGVGSPSGPGATGSGAAAAPAAASAAAPGRRVAGTGGPAPVNGSAPAGSRPIDGKPPGRGFDEAPTAWDDEPTRVGGTQPPPDEPSHEVQRAPAAPAPRDPAEIAARAAGLDFRKVGVTTWKVKVKIGLIYDFSDIKTLRKYIQDGRVTPADVVSWDGKSWRAIGDIPDLDAFFVETWDALAAKKVESPTLNPAPAVEAPRGEDTPSGPKANEPTQFEDPFAAQKRKKAAAAEAKRTAPVVTPPPRKPEPEQKSRLPLVLLALLAVLVIAGGTTWWMGQDTATPVAPPTPGPAVPAAKKTPEEIRAEIEKGLGAAIGSNPAPEDEPDAKLPEGDTPERVPVGAPGPDDRAVRPGSPIPEGATVRVPKNTPPTSSAIKQADSTAGDHEALGDEAANSGDWSTAAQAYQKAVALDKRSSTLAGKLGRALFETGDMNGAQPLLDRAANGGSKDAHKYLGHILRQQGDTGGANSHYQAYLKGSPRDAAEIEKIIAQMNGG